MKKIISLMFALLLMVCAVVSVSAEYSPKPTEPKLEIIVDAIPIPVEAGYATPEITNPERVEVGSGKTVTITATPAPGYKFSHWTFAYGEFDIVEGNLSTPVMIIRPTGTTDVRAEAHFVKEDTTITEPSSTPIPTLPNDSTSPITGTGSTTNAVTGAVIGATVVLMAIVGAVILKKKTNA